MSSSPQNPAEKSPQKSGKTAEIGQLAEILVAQWLTEQGWQILEQRWHCRWGELDLVMLTPDLVVTFVEVKARSRGNWDADGLLSITPTKQEKLMRAAQAFLSTQPQWAEFPCRFDVAMVQVRPQRSSRSGNPIQLGKPTSMGAYSLTLQHYIPAAFDEQI